MRINRPLVSAVAGFIALGLAIIAIIYWAVLANPAFSLNNIDWPLRIMVIGGIVAFSVYLLTSPESVGAAAAKRSNRLTANALVVSLVAVAIAIVLNMIIGSVPTARADLTAGQQFTLSSQTIKLLEGLDAKNLNVQAVAFIDPNAPSTQQQASDLLKEYASHSSRFKYEFVDPVKAPVRASEYGVTRYGVVVFDTGKKREIANAISERDFTSAIVRLEQTRTPTVAFLTGHGERSITGTDQAAYTQIQTALTQNNYSVVSWSLITSPTLTITNVNVLVIAQPMRVLADKEMQTVQSYLDAGGRAMILLDPLMPANVLSQMSTLLKKYDVSPKEGGVVDFPRALSQQDPTFFAVDSYPVTDITRDLSSGNLATAFELSLAVNPPTSTVNWTVSPIVRSSSGQPQGWLETDIKPDNNQPIQLKYDAGIDQDGPITIGAEVESASASSTTVTNTVGTKLVVFGDADWPSDYMLSLQLPIANTDLFNNSISWLAGANDLVAIAPKDTPAARTMVLDATQKNVIFTVAVLGLPALVLIAGGFSWWRRR